MGPLPAPVRGSGPALKALNGCELVIAALAKRLALLLQFADPGIGFGHQLIQEGLVELGEGLFHGW